MFENENYKKTDGCRRGCAIIIVNVLILVGLVVLIFSVIFSVCR